MKNYAIKKERFSYPGNIYCIDHFGFLQYSSAFSGTCSGCANRCFDKSSEHRTGI